jgi:CRISPR/Cas system-associated exonuclease Cas4 (RecB family)
MHLLPATQDDERAGYPSASEYGRLLKCRASHLLAKKAKVLDQVAHQRSEAADLGTKKHQANTEGPEILSEGESADWESCQRKREAFIESWSDGLPIESIKESRLWLRKGLRPLLTGKPDEILRQGNRAAVLDYKFGSYRVADPRDNVQLSIYALLVARDDETVQEVSCQILSPCWDFESVTYGREELDRLYQSVLVVVASLADPGDPVPGDHCHFCPARLICSAARQQAESAMLAKVVELPVGEQAARLLDQIKRAQGLFKEVESYYKRVLESTPRAIPGWALVPGDVRRSITDPVGALERLIETFSVREFLQCCSPSVPELEKTWAKKKGQLATKARAEFGRCMDGLIIEKRNAPSLRQITNNTKQLLST